MEWGRGSTDQDVWGLEGAGSKGVSYLEFRRCFSFGGEVGTNYIFLISLDAITKSHVHVSSDWSDRLSAGYRITSLFTYLLVHPVTPALFRVAVLL